MPMRDKTNISGIRYLLLMVLLCCSITAALAQADKKVTVELRQASIRELFTAIRKQADVGFMYSNAAINGLPRKDYHFRNASIARIIAYGLEGSELTFDVENNRNIVIKRKASTNDIVGSVVDKDGEPMIGVIIRYQGTQRGTTSDINGHFSLASGGKKEVPLRISYLGMKAQEVVWKGRALKIMMQEDYHDIDEVVVTGYQTMDRRKTTAAITSVKMDDILMPDMTSVDQALEGRIPDLLFMQNSGEVGATARLRVRGTSTLVGNREPLWVLDGFVLQDPVNVSTDQLNDPDYINYIGNAISGINPQDIERIDVLKDAAATALYGTRAANGVIVVTTKKGKVGPPTITYSNTTKLTRRPHYSDGNINLMNSQERVEFGKDLTDLHYVFPKDMTMVGYEGAYYRYQTGEISYDQFLNEVKWYETVNTDWFKLLTTDAITHQHTLNISGGSESTRYYTSIGYTRENGTINTEYVDRYTAAMNIMTNITKTLKANIKVNGNIQKKNHLPNQVGVLDYAYNTTRALPAYNEDGTLYYYKTRAYSTSVSGKTSKKYNYNILNEMDNTSDEYNGNTLMVNADLNYKLKNLMDFIVAGSYSRSSTLQATWFGESSNYAAILKNGEADELPLAGETGMSELPYGGVYNTTNTISESFTGRFQANLHWAFGKGDTKSHLLTSTLGYEVNMLRTNGISDQTRGYFKDRGMKYAAMTAEELDKYPLYKEWLAEGHRSMTAGKTNQISGYLTVAYDYKNFFTLGMNGRFDASNKFGSRSNEKFLPVWSVSGRWNLKDCFLRDQRWISTLSLRASYGKTGNMLDNQTPNLLIKLGTLDAFYGENISTVFSLPNPNLRWEQTSSTNIGLDANLFEGRLLLSSDLWFKHTKDAFASINVSTVNGVSGYQMNNGNIDNKGFSFQISGYPIRTKDWKLYLSTGYSWASNTVKTDVNNNFSLNDYLSGNAIIEGQSIGTFYSYKYLGLNPNTGIPMFDDYQDRQHLLEHKKLAEIIPLVMEASGNRQPKLTGSFYTTLTWKQLSLNMNFLYNIGSKVRLFNLYTPIVSGVSSDKNVRKEFVNRWRQPGDEKYTDIPALLSPSDPNYMDAYSHWSHSQASSRLGEIPNFADNVWTMYDNSSLRVVSGDYLKLSNLVLAYTFKPNQLKTTPFKSLRVSLSTANVFTIASKELDGQDPTQPGFAGVSLSTRPSYTFSLNVSF